MRTGRHEINLKDWPVKLGRMADGISIAIHTLRNDLLPVMNDAETLRPLAEQVANSVEEAMAYSAIKESLDIIQGTWMDHFGTGQYAHLNAHSVSHGGTNVKDWFRKTCDRAFVGKVPREVQNALGKFYASVATAQQWGEATLASGSLTGGLVTSRFVVDLQGALNAVGSAGNTVIAALESTREKVHKESI
jgi:hypothetical protein